VSDVVDFLLLGGGLASVSCAETLRAEGADGTIAILSGEADLPYHRPPLSKEFLLGTQTADRLPIRPERFYRDNAITLRLGTRAAAVEPDDRLVLTESGEQIGYRKLLIATGGRANALAVPGAALAGVQTLRTREDSDAIRGLARGAKRAVVIGGSFLGLEVASSLARMGPAVTLIERGPAVMRRLYSEELQDFFARRAIAAGIELVFADTVGAIEGDGKVAALVTAAGRRIPCDLVVPAIGIVPATGFLARSGLALGDGIVVDERLGASHADIFAAGDVASFLDPVFARRHRVEHWDNAVKQGRLAARNMLGRNLPYDEVSYFFADVLDLSFSMLGAPEEADEIIELGSLDENAASLLYLRNDVPRALFSVGRPPEETRAVEGLIRHRVNCAAIDLADPDYPLGRIPQQTVLILQGGGALGAFECGVVKALEEATIHPDIVAGVSIGAFNGAIIASHPREATAALESFWNDLAVATPNLLQHDWTRSAAAWQILSFGVPRFFRPRWLDAFAMLGDWTSLYDTAPIRELIQRYVDFPRLKSSPVRLLVSAVNVETAELETFDSYVDDLTPDHILASGSLPPGFPWTTVRGKNYWDGGIISNSPLDLVLDRCGPVGKRVFIVDLFAGRKPLPKNLLEVMARRDEILFAERIRNDLATRELVEDFRALVEEIMARLGDEEQRRAKQRPRYIQLVAEAQKMDVTRIVREGDMGEPSSRDYDFSRAAIEKNRADGYQRARDAVAKGQ
jgi:NTE family protein